MNEQDHDFSDDAVHAMVTVFENHRLDDPDADEPASARSAMAMMQDIGSVCDAHDITDPERRVDLAALGLRRWFDREAEATVAEFRENLSAQMALFSGDGE